MNFLRLFFLVLLLTTAHAKEQQYDPIKLQLQWKHQFEFAGFYAAKERGFYQEAGLDVTFVEFDKSKDIIGEVLNGNAEYGVAYSSIIAEYYEGKPLVLLANFFKQSPMVLVTQPNIKTLADLRGKKVMGVSKNIHNITLLTMLGKFGITTDDIVNVPTSFNIEDFVSKKVDAMSIYTTNELYYLNQFGIKYNLFDPGVYGAKYYDVNLFTSQKELLEHPQRVKRFREASIRGWKYALQHQEEMIDLILQKYNSGHKSRDALRFEAKQTEQVMLPQIYEVGSVDIDKIKAIADSYIQSGAIEVIRNREIEGFVYEYDINPLGLTADELTFIKTHPKIVLGSDRSQSPFVVMNRDGSLSGFDVEVLRLINQASGANFTLAADDWPQIQLKVRSGEMDGLSRDGIDDENRSGLNFSDSYITMRKMVITSRENPKKIRTLQDLSGKTIAVLSSDQADLKRAEAFPESTVIGYDTIEEVIRSVVSGSSDVLFGDGTTFYLANEMGIPYLKGSVKLESRYERYFALRNDWPEAVGIINKSLDYIGRFKLLELKNSWFWESQTQLYPAVHLTEDEKKYLAHKKSIKMCVDPDWMPFEKIEEGRHIGLAADYMALISKKLHTRIVLVPTESWASSLEKARNRECDILSMVTHTDDREKYMDFTSAYAETPVAIVTKPDQIFIDDLNEYKNKAWGVVKEYSIIPFLRKKYPGINLVEVDSIHEGLKLTEKGLLFGFVGNAVTVGHAIRKEFLETLAITGRSDKKIVFSVATRNDEKILHDVFEKALKSIEPVQRQQIFDRWIKMASPTQTDYSLIWKILAVAMIIVLLFFYRNVLLKQEIVKRKEVEKEFQQLTSKLSEKIHEATEDLEQKNIRLVESVYNFQDIFNMTMEMIVLFDDDGSIVDINRSGVAMLGYTDKSELVGSNFVSYILESELPKVYEDLKKDTHEPYELTLLKQDGSYLYTLKRARRILRDGRKIWLATLMDLTKIKQQNRHLIQQSKMAAMGEMIENIAHQWRQPLWQVNSAVLLLDGLLEQKNINDEQIEGKLTEIESLTQYMSTTINDFKNFFEHDKEQVVFNISETMTKSLAIVQSSLESHHITLETHLDDVMLRGYPNEVQQVLLVLFNNSIDAMIGKNGDNARLIITITKINKNAVITVCDNGGGMDEKIIDKVFDPYFTTKHQSQGTGLGLYISKMIVEDSMHGELEVENTQVGACFTMTLPISEAVKDDC